MDHPSWLWNPLLICEMGSGPFEHGNACCGITQKGDQCKNAVRKEVLKSGRQKLDALAERPFSVCNLQLKLRDIAAEFLCTRWHQLRQADLVGQRWYEAAIRNQPQTCRSQPATRRPLRPVRSTRHSAIDPERRTERRSQSRSRAMDGVEFTGPSISVPSQLGPSSRDRQVTPAMLRENQVTWSVSDEAPAHLMIANDEAGPQALKLKRFTCRSPQSSNSRREKCYVWTVWNYGLGHGGLDIIRHAHNVCTTELSSRNISHEGPIHQAPPMPNRRTRQNTRIPALQLLQLRRGQRQKGCVFLTGLTRPVRADLPDWPGVWVLPLNPSHWALNAVHYDCRVANDSHSETLVNWLDRG